MDAILGYMIAIALSMLTMSQYFQFQATGITNVQTAAVASQQFVVNKAAQQYVQDYGSAIAAQATTTTPVTITAAMLINAGYLPAGFSQTNAFKQAWQVQVLQPIAGQLEAIVETTGGRAITDTLQLVQIASQTGAQGGFVPYAGQNGDPTMSANNAYGAYGSWSIPLAGTSFTNPGSGHLVSLLSFTGVQSNNGFLYRVKVPNHPELNNMQTDLGLTDTGGTAHNITGVATAYAQKLVLTNGTQSTTIENDGAGNTNISQSGALQVMQSGTSTFAPLNSGNVTSSGTFQPGNMEVPGTACSTNGATAGNSDGSGQWVLCWFQKWTPIGGPYSVNGQYVVSYGVTVPAPVCSSGGVGKIAIATENFYVDTTATVNWVTSGAGPWTVYSVDGAGSPISAQGIATTTCAY